MPPMTQQQVTSPIFEQSALKTFSICTASSRVGDRITAYGPRMWPDSLID